MLQKELDMVCTNVILLLASISLHGPEVAAPNTVVARGPALRDGMLLVAVEGKLGTADPNTGHGSDKWFFEFDTEVSDGLGKVRAGQKLELLPCAALQHMIAEAKKRLQENPLRISAIDIGEPLINNPDGPLRYRIRAKVTKYRDVNFLYLISFRPVVESTRPTATSDKSQQPQNSAPEKPPAQEDADQPSMNEPKDEITIPKGVKDRLKGGKIARRPVEPDQRQSEQTAKRDSILAGRIGFVTITGPRSPGQWENLSFVLDSLGRKLEQDRFGLLPCGVLEWAERRQAAEPDPLRFKIAGITTEYEGKKYLLPQRIVRAYSHRNFGR
jgi:hypothetical protein